MMLHYGGTWFWPCMNFEDHSKNACFYLKSTGKYWRVLTKSDITTFVFKKCHAVYYIDTWSGRSGVDAGWLKSYYKI